jgi:hypothetical protein
MTAGLRLRSLVAALVAGTVACGRTDPGDEPAEPRGDASLLDAAADATHRYVEATVSDSYAAPDRSPAPDSALDALQPLDAAEGPDATTDASAGDAGDASAGDASDAGEAADAGPPTLACDECGRGQQQCGPLPQVCIYNDAGLMLSCSVPGQTIWTCAAGDAGCAIWEKGLPCRPDVPCCGSCRFGLDCAGVLGDPCQQDTDCVTDACDAVLHECISNQCGDGRQDGSESDVDCGGPICNSCLPGKRCRNDGDCFSGHPCGSSHVCD